MKWDLIKQIYAIIFKYTSRKHARYVENFDFLLFLLSEKMKIVDKTYKC